MKSLMLVLGVSCELIGVLALWVVHSRYACLGDKVDGVLKVFRVLSGI